jgi:NAD(P) transhydrogenase subunit beta
MSTWLNVVYLIAAVCFILALKGLSSPKTARYGNAIGALGMLVAVISTFFIKGFTNTGYVLAAMAIGLVIGIPAARLVKMTAMPQMVAAFNGVGGAAAAVVSLSEFVSTSKPDLFATYQIIEILIGIIVGCVSFAGSVIAFIKLQELITGRPITYPGQQFINAVIFAAAIALSVIVAIKPTSITSLWYRICVTNRRSRRSGINFAFELLHRTSCGCFGICP